MVPAMSLSHMYTVKNTHTIMQSDKHNHRYTHVRCSFTTTELCTAKLVFQEKAVISVSVAANIASLLYICSVHIITIAK